MEVTSKLNKGRLKNIALTVALVGLSALFAFAIARYNTKMGILLIGAMVGITVTFISVKYTFVGLQVLVIVGFVFADIGRLTNNAIPFGILIDTLMFLIFAGMIIKKRFRHEPFLAYCRHPIVYAYLVIIAYSLLQVGNPDGYGPANTIIILRRFIVLQMYLYCCIQIFDLQTFNKFLKYFMFFSVLAALYGCYQEWAGYPQYELDHINSDPKLLALYASDVGGGFRKFSTLTDPTAFGILMAVMAAVNITLIVTTKFNFLRFFLLAASTMFLLLAMGYSGTRTAVAALTSGVAVYILMTLNNPKTLAFAAFALMSFIVIIYGPIYGNPTINRIRSTFEFNEDESLNVRNVNRHAIQPYMHSHPIGGGLGTTGGTAGEVALTTTYHPLAGFPSDSGFLKMALEFGWVGLIIQCVGFFIVLQQGVHAYFRANSRPYKRAFLVAVITLFSFMMAHYAQVAIGPSPGAFLFYAMIAGIVKLSQVEPSLSNKLKPI
jgi:putative inorganic carbon (hco3(-)) transporter